jgi:hypothetical protein
MTRFFMFMIAAAFSAALLIPNTSQAGGRADTGRSTCGFSKMMQRASRATVVRETRALRSTARTRSTYATRSRDK